MRICVIGAGACGLVAAKKLLDEGLSPTVFERNAEAGGNWLYGVPGSSVYRSTHLISSKRLTEFRDFPLPAEWPPYIRHDQALEYLRRYADRFGLYRHVRFGVEVIRCEREEDGRWRVSTSEGEETFNALVVASGHHREPEMPVFEGSFEGEILHSHFYKVPDPFRDRRVLVIGAGNSGCDIAVELAGVASRVFHSTRRGYCPSSSSACRLTSSATGCAASASPRACSNSWRDRAPRWFSAGPSGSACRSRTTPCSRPTRSSTRSSTTPSAMAG